MGKQRMTLLDLRAAVVELRTKLIGLRLANVYDVNSRCARARQLLTCRQRWPLTCRPRRSTYLLKFSRPGSKFLLLVESGTRVHTTQFTRDKSNIPSGFSMKVGRPAAPGVAALTGVPWTAAQAHSHAPPRSNRSAWGGPDP